MATRKVCVASSAGKAVKLDNFNGTTWGDLKAEATVSPLLVGDYEAIVKPGNVTLRDDSSVLPEGELKVFVIPKKNKAGLTEAEAKQLGKEIANAIVNANTKAQKEEIDELRNDIIDVIENHFNVELEVEVDDCKECTEAINEAKELANS